VTKKSFGGHPHAPAVGGGTSVNRRNYLLGAASAVTLASAKALCAAVQSGEDTSAQYDPQVRYDIKIPMRDGVHLSAILFLPRGRYKARAAIFSLGPYTADWYHPEGIAFASHGFAYLAVDERGRGDSEGTFDPFFNSPDDGHDLVEWIASQSFCNGKVAANGHSYVGFTQWAAVRGAPSHLATMVPASACYAGYDFPLRHNIFFAFVAPWLTETGGRTRRRVTSADDGYWAEQQVRFLESGLPFRKLGEFFGFDNPCFQEWLKHPHQDAYWDRGNPTAEQFANLTMPVLSLCGQFDGDQLGAIEFYRQHLSHAGAKADHYLIVGPWGHEGVRKPVAEYAGLTVGANSVLDMLELQRSWYGWTMDGGNKPSFLKKRVAYYVMVADIWRYADTLEGVTSSYQTLHLDSAINPSSAFHSGTLAPAPATRAEPDHFVYDPRDLSAVKLQITQAKSYLFDQTMVLGNSGGKLVYHSEPFAADTEVSGFFKFTVWLGIDTPDTDFHVAIYEIDPDGSSLLLTEHQLRARHRVGLRIEKLIETRAPLRYDFDRFTFVSRRIKQGHMLRLVIGPNTSIVWQKNYNSGKPVADETMADARAVTVRLYHDAAHPSALIVPIGQPEA
jgi:putative CocE/NonD family hydrolase